jgi:hypothetical protein
MSKRMPRGLFEIFAFITLAIVLCLLAYVGMPDFFGGNPATPAPADDNTTSDESAEAIAATPIWQIDIMFPNIGAPDKPATPEELEAAIQQLADMTNGENADKGHKLLLAAGEWALPILIAHFEDPTPANVPFGGKVVEPADTFYPTIGDVCKDILEYQIEGAAPKARPDDDLLAIKDLAELVAKAPDADLWTLRILALEKKLAIAGQATTPDVNLFRFLNYNNARVKAWGEMHSPYGPGAAWAPVAPGGDPANYVVRQFKISYRFDPDEAPQRERMTPEELEQAIKDLGNLNNADVANAAYQRLLEEGIAAFEVVIAHFADKDIAANRCFQGRVGVAPGVVYPSIRSTCWDLLSDQLEGGSFGPEPNRTLLTPENLSDWLAAHKDLGLWELRVAAIKEEIAMLEASEAPNEGLLRFLKYNLPLVQAMAK